MQLTIRDMEDGGVEIEANSELTDPMDIAVDRATKQLISLLPGERKITLRQASESTVEPG